MKLSWIKFSRHFLRSYIEQKLGIIPAMCTPGEQKVAGESGDVV